MSKKIGNFIRVISMYWMVFALLRTLAGLVGIGNNKDVIRGLISIAIAVTLYFLGRWLQTFSITESLEKTKSIWWRADHKFRLVIFLNAAWILGAVFFRDDYYYDWNLILYPPLILLILYLGYAKLVVGASSMDLNIIENSKVQKNDHALPSPSPSPSPSVTDIGLTQSSKDRDRAMDELIQKMSNRPTIK